MASRSDLPPGWLRQESKSQPGRFYYYNKATKTTTWVKPSHTEVEEEEVVLPKKSKPSKKDKKEQQSAMVPRAIWSKNNPIKTAESKPATTPRKILPNVSVVNQKNCSLVANYGSDSGKSEGEEEKHPEVSLVKKKLKRKKQPASQEEESKESSGLSGTTGREKIKIKWIQSFQEKKLPHLPLAAEAEEPKKKMKKIKKVKTTTKSKGSQKLTKPARISKEGSSSKKKVKKETGSVKLKTLKRKKLIEAETCNSVSDNSNTPSSALDSLPPKKKKIVKKIKKTKPFSLESDQTVAVSCQLQTECPTDIPGNLQPSTATTVSNRTEPDVFGFRDLYQPMEVDSCQEEEAMVVDIEQVRKMLICQPSDEVTGDLTGRISAEYTTVDNSSNQLLYVTLDTNVLLTKCGLSVVEKLRDGFYSDIENSPFIVVPWVVMQELDALKSKSKTKSAVHAQRAISFLFCCFNSKHPRVIGQTSREAMEQDCVFVVENNDDKVLQCCMQFQKKYPRCSVVLFSNDKNLCNKALINNITAHNQQSIESGLKKMSVQLDLDFNLNNSKNNVVVDTSTSEKCPDVVCENVDRESLIATQIFSKVKYILEKLLCKIFEIEMKLAFGDIWIDILIRKPPWDLIDVLFCIKKHWIAVFGMTYDGNTRPIEAMFITLYEFFAFDKDPVKDIAKVLLLIKNSQFVLKPLARKSEKYQEDVNVNLKILHLLENMCTQIFSKSIHVNTINNVDDFLEKYTGHEEKCSPAANEAVTIDETLALNIFQRTWELLHQYCQKVEQTLQRDSTKETCQQILASLSHSIPVLETTYMNFSNCLNQNVNKSCDNESFNSLSQQLNLLLTELDSNDNSTKVTSAHLQALFTIPDKQEMLSTGLGQLEAMIRGLHTYYSKLMVT
ncbi:transcriptional protein SWT1-like [Argonauta hians]